MDDFGRCSARYHDRECHQVIEASAATSNADAVSAWNVTLASGGPDPEAVLLSVPEPWGGGDFWEDVFDSGGPDPALRAQMMDILGGEMPRGPARPRMDLSAIKAALGL